MTIFGNNSKILNKRVHIYANICIIISKENALQGLS